MINTNVNRALYKGDGNNTVFPIPFPFLEKKDITVAVIDTEGETTELAKDYFIDDTSRRRQAGSRATASPSVW